MTTPISHNSSSQRLIANANDDGSVHSATSATTEAQSSRGGSTRARSAVVNRRSHAKSKTGCRTCKKRRIKCDESRPSCRNCRKHAVICDFTILPGASSASAADTSQGPIYRPACDVINMMDLELIHNFITFTCATLVSDPAVRQLLRTTAIQMALDCEYLMRSILAVSALHLSRYRPQKKALYIQCAIHHHQAASSVAIALLADLKPDECERLHLFSMLTVYYALGCPVDEADLSPDTPLIPHWLRLLHGMEPILHMLKPQEYRGVLAPLFDFGRRRMQPYLKTTPPRDPSLLADIQSHIYRTCSNPDLIPIYDDMIEQLRRMLGLILPPPSRCAAAGAAAYRHAHSLDSRDSRQEGSSGAAQSPDVITAIPESSAEPLPWTKLEAWDILIWQWTQGKHFLPLLDAANPPQEALVIFVYCLLVVRKLENQWYVEGWADHLMAKTWALLDEEHRHWAVWATEEMGWVPPR
ncbi:hypothetical protein VTK26DRAFT_6270 [Humicola hyalothermophila]